MKTSVVISLDTRRAKKDGSYPLILRLTHHRDDLPIPLGLSIQKKDWDENSRSVKARAQNAETATRINAHIKARHNEAVKTILKLQETGDLDRLSVADIKNRIHKPISSQSFILFTQEQIEALKQAQRFGTAKSYKEVLHVVKEFIGPKDLPFNQINFQFLTRFETVHVAKGNSMNSLAVYMRTIRAIYNKAIKSGIIDGNNYPFNNYKIKTVPTEKRALEWDLLKKIILYKLPTDHSLFNARNYFIASYMMYGMNYSDMAFLRKSDIRDGRIQYCRRKTSKLYDIKVTEALNDILLHYSALTNESEFIFPILKSADAAKQYQEILWARKRYNKKLKQLASELGIEQNLTSYVSRHSFATQAMLHEIPLNAISSMLGHSNLKTTEIYLKSLSTSSLDDFNARLLQNL